MPEENCPSCDDYAPGVSRAMRGEPVRGVEDVIAYVRNIPDNAPGSPWPTGENARVELLSGIPAPAAEMARAPETPATHPAHDFPPTETTQPQPPTIHDKIIDATPQTTVEYLPRLGAPWFTLLQSNGTEEEKQKLDEKAKESEDVEDGGQTDDDTHGKPEWGTPEEGHDYIRDPFIDESAEDVDKRPPKGGGPTITYPGEDARSKFIDDWDDSDAWLPDGEMLLACPTEVTHKVSIWWIESSKIGTAKSRDDAEKLGKGALESNDPEDIVSDNVSNDVLAAKVNAFLDDRNWTCEPNCRREIEIDGHLYRVSVKIKIYDALIGNEEAFTVEMDIVHRLFAWVKIMCVQ